MMGNNEWIISPISFGMVNFSYFIMVMFTCSGWVHRIISFTIVSSIQIGHANLPYVSLKLGKSSTQRALTKKFIFISSQGNK